MKSFLLCLLFCALSEVAVGQALLSTPDPISAPAAKVQPEPALSLFPDCKNLATEVVGLADGSLQGGGKLAGAFLALMAALSVLSQALGWLASHGSGSASKALLVVRYISALLGWLTGKMGWGAPKNDLIKKLPKFKAMKAEAGPKLK